MATRTPNKIALIGLGSIGISFAALHIQHTDAHLSVYDPRPDLQAHLESILPLYLGEVSKVATTTVADLLSNGRLRLASSVEDACAGAHIVQEQGPENLEFKRRALRAIEASAPPEAHLWSSTSGIPVSAQAANMKDRARLLVVHPFNPPHILPLIEISPGPETAPERVRFAKTFFETLGSGHCPVVVRKEVPGFVGNRLAFALLREAVSLVNEGVVDDVSDIDTVVEASLGPRWAVQGPFKSYAMGGGTGGLGAFLKNLAGSIQTVWDDQSRQLPNILDKDGKPADWVDTLVAKTDAVYGLPTPVVIEDRDVKLRRLLEARK
ncbi:3-hydroxyacyl-CoA dehydrogenase, NAD binding protein [Sporothrix brasiliensis 5110]|uniref:L-gulonate 3-dehydrogenase n=1 Tax=Sporothrix brasiliensis 5110 TaxID=1398154 RepID=A0A0C2ELQ5_9PEZI|nr:3-hydroxyacyl-CoA dehydrogenase, NAD binding protein [Sporothrix brasiliensis 5110]KIH87054.1 3-hydroxyacyl-CoA dehydrogenase, NAD binding protein [Sporothrix brasiliensis 5110]